MSIFPIRVIRVPQNKTMTYQTRAAKIFERINELAAITEQPGMVTRTYGSAAFIQGAALVATWMHDAGLQTSTDHIGNVRGRLLCQEADAQTFIIGSHMDTVVDAGKFDGPLGIIMGLDLLENIVINKIALPFNVELIAFADEEGVRFHTTYLGSKVVAGSFDNILLAKTDKSGTTLNQAIQQIGGDPALLRDAAISDKLLGYLELHIEQGPVLYKSNNPVAVVTGIAGQKRIELIFTGTAGHAGTVPMDMRQDALCCAAECIVNIEEFGQSHNTELVATVGKLDIENPASNVIPGMVKCTLDLRSADEVRLAYAATALQNILTEICGDRTIGFQWNLVQETKPVICDAALNKHLQQAITDAGFEPIELVSGAGHDAVPMAAICPVTMLFVRCFKGISHNPLEDVELKDIEAAVEVGDKFLLSIH